jgi:hypothetical protein
MRAPAETVVETAWRALRVAAAVFMLGFMIGDLFFPQYFCEEYVVYETDGAAVMAAMSRTTSLVEPSSVTTRSDEETMTPQLGPVESGGDFCLHIVPPQLFSVADSTLKPLPPCAELALIPPSVDPKNLYHPPRSL